MPDNLKVLVHDDTEEVDELLIKLFGISKENFLEIVRQVVAAKRNTTDDDACFASGMYAYLRAVPALRSISRRLGNGWEPYRKGGLEGIFNEGMRRIIIPQNVDMACSKSLGPKSISRKGRATQRIVNSSLNMPLFDSPIEEASPQKKDGYEIWYLCISDDIVIGTRAEISCPISVVDGQFSGFSERIFIVQKGEFDGLEISDDFDVQEQNYDIKVSRKEG